MRIAIVFLCLLIIPISLTSGCASDVPATITRAPTTPIEKSGKFFLVATRQRERIKKSLIDAGLNATDALTADSYVITVAIGGGRATRVCGSVNNVNYVLSLGGQRIVIIKGRGATGTCEPNIFDDMSRKLASIAISGG